MCPDRAEEFWLEAPASDCCSKCCSKRCSVCCLAGSTAASVVVVVGAGAVTVGIMCNEVGPFVLVVAVEVDASNLTFCNSSNNC